MTPIKIQCELAVEPTSAPDGGFDYVLTAEGISVTGRAYPSRALDAVSRMLQAHRDEHTRIKKLITDAIERDATIFQNGLTEAELGRWVGVALSIPGVMTYREPLGAIAWIEHAEDPYDQVVFRLVMKGDTSCE